MTIQGRVQSISMQDLAVMELPEFAKLWTVSMHFDMPDFAIPWSVYCRFLQSMPATCRHHCLQMRTPLLFTQYMLHVLQLN